MVLVRHEKEVYRLQKRERESEKEQVELEIPDTEQRRGESV